MSARELPNSKNEERAVISTIVFNSQYASTLTMNLDERCFYHTDTRTAFEIIKTMVSENKNCDFHSVETRLCELGLSDKVNLGSILDENCPSTAMFDSHVETLKKLAIRRRLIATVQDSLDTAFDLSQDAEETLSTTQTRLFDIQNHASRKEETTGEAAQDVVKRWGEIMDGTDIFGLPPFLTVIKKTLGNFVEGNPYFIAAEPAGGKSVFVQNQLMYWAMHGKPVAIASLEMTRKKFVSRMIGDVANISSWAMDNREFGDSDYAKTNLERARNAADVVSRLPMWIGDHPMNVDEFCSWALAMKNQHDIAAVGIDYLQLLSAPERLRLRGIEALQYVCSKLQNFSKSTGVITLVLSQITKLEKHMDGKKRKPMQDDLFGGRIIDATSEGTIMLYQLDGIDYADIVKNRNGGIGQVPVIFERNRQRFIERK